MICTLLTRSYQPLKELNEFPWIPSDSMWKEYDDHIFEDLAKTDEIVSLTELDGIVVGFFSFFSDGTEATISRNCVLPENGGKGVGTGQVVEIVRRCNALGVKSILVVTGEHRFFAPAQRMYLKAGFREIEREDDGRSVGRVLIKYKLDLGR